MNANELAAMLETARIKSEHWFLIAALTRVAPSCDRAASILLELEHLRREILDWTEANRPKGTELAGTNESGH